MKTFLCLMAILAAALTARAQGSLEAMQGYVSASGNLNAVYSQISAGTPMTLGWTFQSQTDINVTALGAFNDVLHNSGNLEIGIWNSSGDLLTSSLVALTGTSSDSVYQSVTPVMLTAGQTYYLGAYSPSQTVYFYVVGPDSDTHGYAIMSPEIQLGGLAFNTNSVFAFPSSTEGQPSDAVVMPNFQFQAVPEPSTVCLLVGGAMVLLAMRRKSNRQ
jgi:Domain of unknown function (DUF4082)